MSDAWHARTLACAAEYYTRGAERYLEVNACCPVLLAHMPDAIPLQIQSCRRRCQCVRLPPAMCTHETST